jgi:imidazoleglycerol-phosphate dehydratase
MAHLFTIHESSKDYIKIQKKTQELDIMVELSTVFRPELRPETTSDFLDHAVETLSWGSCISIGVKVETGKWRSTHTIAEDVGITMGAGLKKLYYQRLQDEGVNILGSGTGCLDETLVRATVGVEGRRNTFMHISPECTGAKLELVEDLKSGDLVSCIEGFFQGFPATCHVEFLQGKDSHHVWESAFHAIGEALRMAMAPNPWRIAKNNPYYGEEGIADASLI